VTAVKTFDRIALIIVIGASFALVFIAVLNDFYVYGDMGDIGWFASAAWHNGFDLHGPPAHNFSFFNVHMTPILWLTNAVSYALPLSKIDYYAALCGGIYALFGAGVYRLWLMAHDTEGRPARFDGCAAGIVALAATFSAIGVQALRVPHLEMGIPAFALWFFLCLSQRRFVAASVFFILCLLIREDAGLHLFGWLIVWLITLKTSHRHDLQRHIGLYAALALLYAVVALMVKYQFFMKMDNMSIVYSGNPPWHHLGWPVIGDRLSFFLLNRTYITLPFLLALGWGFYACNPFIPLGYVAALPWLLWNLMAVRPSPAHLDFYYGFPFWLALAWPLLALEVWPREEDSSAPERWPYFFLLLVSLAGWQQGQLTVYPFSVHSVIDENSYEGNLFVIGPEWGRASAMQSFTDYFAAHQSSFTHAVMDVPVQGVVIDSNATVMGVGEWNFLHPSVLPDMIVYFDGGYDWHYWVKPSLQSYPERFVYFYQLPNTKIRIAATQPLENLLPQPMPFAPVEK